MSYNKDTNIFFILTEEKIEIYKEKDNFTLFELKIQIPLKDIIETSLKEDMMFKTQLDTLMEIDSYYVRIY